MKVQDFARTLKQEVRNTLARIKTHGPHLTEESERSILRDIRTKGFYVIPHFYSAEKCASVREEINRLIEEYTSKISVDPYNSDHRLFGADRVSETITSFYQDPFITRIVEAHEQTKNIVGFTLAARLDFKPGNPGSGDGWHRDWSVREQIKAILYLSDVSEKNGPFQYVTGSFRPLSIITDMWRNNFSFNQNRFTNDEMNSLLARGERKRKLVTFPAKAGTLILVNTRGLHRGMPIEEGSRYALTNYYWSNMPIPEHIARNLVR